MGLHLHLEGRASPAHNDLLEEIARFIPSQGMTPLAHLERAVSEDGHPSLMVALHPAAEDVELVVHGLAVRATAKTSTAGPGYHRHVCDLLRRIGETFAISWTRGNAADDSEYFFTSDHDELERQTAQWLSETATQIIAMHEAGATQMALSMPTSHAFQHNQVVATPLGPRDLAWLRAVEQNGRAGFDIFPWAELGMGAGYSLGRALSLMWTDVRWRTPVSEDETSLLEEVVRALEAAYRADPKREYPWNEWAEILAFLGKESLLATRAQLKASTAKRGEPIGYRRGDVVTHLSGGWSVRLPGDFAETWDAQGTFCAWDGTRTVWFTSVSYTPAGDPNPSIEETLAGLPPLPGETLTETEGRVLRRASFTEGSEGDQTFKQLNAYVGFSGQAGIATICFEDPDDQEWALSTWRSILRTEAGR
ncbi:MAG: hypothetical protein IPK60_06530 [Sandaracinaceae bacterium]|nr:hypothetical protein [Sandaracinaceae bacterium]